MIRLASFRHAWNGIILFASSERHAFIHLLATLFVVVLGQVFALSSLEWIAILICISLVISTEIINTAIEKLTDMVSPQISPGAKAVKDLGAGAVLLSSIVAIIVGLIIFAPKISIFLSS